MPDDLIGVSCGHRVPRIPVEVESSTGRRRAYWCARCGQHRMSGGKASGRHSDALNALLEVRDEIERRELEVAFPHRLEPWQEDLVRALGATPVYPGSTGDAMT